MFINGWMAVANTTDYPPRPHDPYDTDVTDVDMHQAGKRYFFYQTCLDILYELPRLRAMGLNKMCID